MERDPLADDPPRPDGPCPRCDGARWVLVTPVYAERLAPVPDVAGLPDDQAAALLREAHARRAALTDSWYPCRDCNRAQFFRWAGGHLASDHDRAACDECRAEMPAPRQRVHRPMATEPRERRDLA